MVQPTIGTSDALCPPPYLLEDGEGERISHFQSTVIVKAAGPTLDIAVVHGKRARGLLHKHEDVDEAIFVIAGEVHVEAGQEELRAAAGAFIFLPRRVPHLVSVISSEASWLVIFSATGSLLMFDEIAAHMAGGEGFSAIAETLRRHGVSVLG